ncbi:hypothetical protein ACHQM5_009178 [Ranunculus cassubicifolius]
MAEEHLRSDTKKKVMVAIDESEYSEYALKWTLDTLGASISSSSLFIFTAQPVTDLGYLYTETFGTAVPPDLISSVREQQNKVASALLEKAKEICSSRGVTPKLITDVGDPKVAICEAVEKLKINLLVLGSQGKGVLKRAFLGSVSNYCVQHAKCPVLVVRKTE